MAKRRRTERGEASSVNKRQQAENDGGQRDVRKLGKKAAYLGFVKEMPIDVFYEVLGHLEPMDLLNLARTCKSLRQILLNKSMLPIWRTVIKKAKLPRCPPDINEIQYVQFMCGRTCDFCDRPKNLHTFWTHRVKACTDCMKDPEYFVDIMTIPAGYLDINESSFFTSLGERRISILKVDYDECNEMMVQMGKNWSFDCSWARERQLGILNSKVDAHPFEQWLAAREYARSTERNQLKAQRFNYAVEKLREEGWGSKVDSLGMNQRGEMRCLKSINVARPLTNRTWATMRKEVVAFIENVVPMQDKGFPWLCSSDSSDSED